MKQIHMVLNANRDEEKNETLNFWSSRQWRASAKVYNAFVQKTPNFRREGTNVWRSVLDARN